MLEGMLTCTFFELPRRVSSWWQIWICLEKLVVIYDIATTQIKVKLLKGVFYFLEIINRMSIEIDNRKWWKIYSMLSRDLTEKIFWYRVWDISKIYRFLEGYQKCLASAWVIFVGILRVKTCFERLKNDVMRNNYGLIKGRVSKLPKENVHTINRLK